MISFNFAFVIFKAKLLSARYFVNYFILKPCFFLKIVCKRLPIDYERNLRSFLLIKKNRQLTLNKIYLKYSLGYSLTINLKLSRMLLTSWNEFPFNKTLNKINRKLFSKSSRLIARILLIRTMRGKFHSR